MDHEAEELNKILIESNKVIYELLSNKGKAIYFPKDGILAQTAKAKCKKINATIGIALNDNGSTMKLNSISNNVNLNPEKVFPYAPSYGIPKLREVWLSKINEKNPSLKTATTTPLVTSGITHGLSITGFLFINPGEKIITPNLFWGNYKLIFENGYEAKLDKFNMFNENLFDLESFKCKLEEENENGTKKKIVLLNFPNNPTGYTLTEIEANKIVEIIRKSAEGGNKIVVICDDAYFGLFYKDESCKESIFSKLAHLHENILAIKLDGATKEDYAWGFRVGFITYSTPGIDQNIAKVLEDKTAGVIRATVSNISHLSQSLLLNSFNSDKYKNEKKENRIILNNRFNVIEETLKDKKYQKYFSPLPFNSGYFMCVKIKDDVNSEKLREKLLEKYDTGIISQGNLFRIAFSSISHSSVKQLFENIYNACDSVHKEQN